MFEKQENQSFDREHFRNGKTGEILSSRVSPSSPDVPASVRTQRTALQKALLAHVPPGVIKLRKRLLSIVDLGQEGVRLHFEDGEEVISDLVVGADGIRSVRVNITLKRQQSLIVSPGRP